MNMNKKKCFVFYLLPLILFSFALPKVSSAALIFKPFGGKVLAPPTPSACGLVTIPATLGTISIDELKITTTNNNVETLGIIRVGFGTIFPLFTYSYGHYYIPGVSVLGTSVNLCKFCDENSKIPGAGAACGKVNALIEKLCGAVVDTSCPITNLVFSIGTGLLP